MRDALKFFALLFSVLAVCAVLVLIILSVIATGAYFVDKHRCAGWEKTTHRQTYFSKTSAVTWDCFTPDNDGKLIPISQLRSVN